MLGSLAAQGRESKLFVFWFAMVRFFRVKIVTGSKVVVGVVGTDDWTDA